MLRTEPLFHHDSGVPVFPDHADKDAFWYLPANVDFARRADGSPILSFIKYRNPAGQGGGFLSFQVDLTLPPRVRSAIESRLLRWSEEPRLIPVPFTQGSVQCVALDSGKTVRGDAAAPTASAPLVSRVLGTAKPSLQGNNSAIFTLALSPDGAEVVAAALKGGAAMLGVIYKLDYTAMQPPLRVKVTARMEEIYRYFGLSVSGEYQFLKADIAAGIERMKAERKLVIEKVDTVGTPASAREVEAATKLFVDMLVRDWFKAVLVPGQPRTPLDPATIGTPDGGIDGWGGGATDGTVPEEAGAGEETNPYGNPFG